MIEFLFPRGVAAAEAFDDPIDARLLPAEESLISQAVDKRRREFTTARHCGRTALAQLGLEPVPILRGERGMPLWPANVVGSLTHCDGYRAAAVAYSMQIRSLGIDAEPHEALPDGVLGHTSLPAEREVLATRDEDLHWDRLLFCAKEATYKAWFPLTGRWLGFEDAHITFTREPGTPGPVAGQAPVATGTFTSQILIDGAATDGGPPLLTLPGRWLIAGGLIMTAIALT
ncbi:putative phosphopantetheinyl transferase [Gordonia hirsuta DSM 44140 = NBRC 16056]|uniref:Putative phosphopantetheinyl transferase n=1 Tax=Gordonia hirsuta DSM 44140 = NBRC 16056 TaxID=1121927 RepID=L7LCS0_9ACTN|nr:4'-phosphopantetheinyl transferase superfamily protein [Gordonia hirsuta]GAC58516.1 putative phosphopantetheinyl transferase [Gordonia hirsuta DSM 44140 = NBRC 16056]